jgi:hypothetical protein
VRKFLENNGMSRFDCIGRFYGSGERHNLSANRAGFRRSEGEEQKNIHDDVWWQYLILPETWREEVCKGFDANAIARAVASRGWLESDADHLTKRIRIPTLGAMRLYLVPAAFMAESEGDNPE